MGGQIALRCSREVYHLHDLAVLVVLLIRYHHGGAARSLLAANGRVAVAYAGKVNELRNLLMSFGANAVMDLKPEQLGAFATGLRELGAKI